MLDEGPHHREERQMAESGHTPPKGVQRVGQRAVRWIEAGKAGRNFTDVGRARADQLARGEQLSDAEVKKVKAYFAAGGSGAGQPKTPARWLIAAKPNSPKAIRSISR